MGKLLRHAPASGKLFRRSTILDGTVQVAYGPGHNAAMFGGGTALFPSQELTPWGTYTPPTDWIAAGKLLRMPQSVWLIGDLYPYTGDPDIPIGDDDSYPNPGYTEQGRLIQEFNAAKATIEAIRPGRTWVSVFTRAVQGDDSGLAGNVSRFDPTTNLPVHYPQGGGPCVKLPFIGFHVGMSVPLQAPVFGEVEESIIAGIPGGWYDDYDTFKYLIYKTTLAYQDIPETASATYYDGQIDQNDYIDDVASALAPFGRHHVMPSSSSLTSSAVVAAVAEHFGFDPGSGEDL